MTDVQAAPFEYKFVEVFADKVQGESNLLAKSGYSVISLVTFSDDKVGIFLVRQK